MATGSVTGDSIFINLQERGGKKSDTNAPYKRTEQITAGRKANLLIRSLKYKLQEARTFWWTSNSLPSTIIFRSVNSFALRCWFNSFNISAEQRRQTVPGFPLRVFLFLLFTFQFFFLSFLFFSFLIVLSSAWKWNSYALVLWTMSLLSVQHFALSDVHSLLVWQHWDHSSSIFNCIIS